MEEVYESSFSYRWGLLDDWLSKQVRMGEAFSRDDVVVRVVSGYLKNVIASQERNMARLFDLSAGEVEGALVRLADERLITRGVPIQDLPGRWVLWGAAVPLRC
ncbi:MAG: hypothetical protein V3U42_12100 [candidate division NC10 bacterium]